MRIAVLGTGTVGRTLGAALAAVGHDVVVGTRNPGAMFVPGDHPEATSVITGLLEELGWRDVVDRGEPGAARGREMWLPLWLRLFGAIGHPCFNLKIVC